MTLTQSLRVIRPYHHFPVTSCSHSFTNEFVEDILAKFKRDILLKLVQTDFRLMDTLLPVEFGLPENVTCRKIIVYALKTLKIKTFSSHYTIEFDLKTYYPSTLTRLITLLNAITYGSILYKGIPIIANECETLNKNLEKLYRIYLYTGVVI